MKNQLLIYINLIKKHTQEQPVLRILVFSVLIILGLLIIASIFLN